MLCLCLLFVGSCLEKTCLRPVVIGIEIVKITNGATKLIYSAEVIKFREGAIKPVADVY